MVSLNEGHFRQHIVNFDNVSEVSYLSGEYKTFFKERICQRRLILTESYISRVDEAKSNDIFGVQISCKDETFFEEYACLFRIPTRNNKRPGRFEKCPGNIIFVP